MSNNEANNKKLMRGAIALVGAAVLGGSMFYGIQGLYSAPEATSPVQTYTVNTGEFDISVAPDSTRTWAQKLPPMAAGDKVYNYATMVNNSDVAVGSMYIESKPNGALLQGETPIFVSLQGCTKPWTKNGECSANPVTIFPNQKGGSYKLKYNLPSKGTLYIKATAELPIGSGNEYQGKIGSMGYAFTAEQALDESSFPKPESR